ncbi:uncharacterized protein METZ01_LOCUS41602 [marine metagenome]|uniref:Tail sheath protein C-terminal domain-containing protein n=1 Tax=marine metagenome TaxID=408172 RepID=A0A381RCS0_9ZZZZ
MPFTVSPGVLTREIDLTTIVPTLATNIGGFSGLFRWGPIEDPENGRVASDADLKAKFFVPNEDNYVSWMSASNFLLYGGVLEISRTANSLAKNASSANTTYAATQAGATVLIKNKKAFETTYDPSTGGSSTGTYGPWVATYAGERGNSLKVSVCGPDKAAKRLTGGGVAINATTGLVASTSDSLWFEEVRNGDVLEIGGENYLVNNVMNTQGTDTAYVVQTPGSATVTVQSAGTPVDCLVRSAYEEKSSQIFGTITNTGGTKAVTGTGTFFSTQLRVGDMIVATDATGAPFRHKVASITSNTELQLVTASEPTKGTLTATESFGREWEYACNPGETSVNGDAPGTSVWAEARGASQDEIHIVVIDEDGNWGTSTTASTGDTLIERWNGVSVASNSPDYYKSKVNNTDAFPVWAMSHPATGSVVNGDDTTDSAWGTAAVSSTKFNAFGWSQSWSLNGGLDGQTLSIGDRKVGYDTFKEPVDSTASLLFMGDASAALSAYVMSTIAEKRKDLVVFCSPERSDVLGTTTQASNVIDYRNGLPSTSYGFMDSGWQKQWDQQNGVNRYIPLNAHIAGLAVATENTMGSFWSPAGYTRGQIRGGSDLAWNPSEADRDILYNKGINSVVNFPGEGRMLFGDKTLLAKPNAFDRINVRRLFITLEKSISQAAKQSLFEFNDDFTRTQFTSIVEPFLRDIQARGGITDFMVVCDGSNNPPSVVDANQFVGAIYVKPARSINFIELSFVSVRTGVSFSEVVQR